MISFTTFAQGTNDNTQDFMANEAWKAACNFMRRSFGKTDAVKDVVTFDTLGATALYAFNFEDGGYVLTSGNKKSDPILAYSQTGSFLPEDSIDNENLLEFLSACKYEVMSRRDSQTQEQKTEPLEKWNYWLNDDIQFPVNVIETITSQGKTSVDL